MKWDSFPRTFGGMSFSWTRGIYNTISVLISTVIHNSKYYFVIWHIILINLSDFSSDYQSNKINFWSKFINSAFNHIFSEQIKIPDTFIWLQVTTMIHNIMNISQAVETLTCFFHFGLRYRICDVEEYFKMKELHFSPFGWSQTIEIIWSELFTLFLSLRRESQMRIFSIFYRMNEIIKIFNSRHRINNDICLVFLRLIRQVSVHNNKKKHARLQ